MQFLAHVGIALATDGRRLGQRADPARRCCSGAAISGSTARARRNLPRIAAAALGMGVVLVLLRIALGPALAGPLLRSRSARSRRWSPAGLAAFALLALAFGVADWRDLLGRLRRQPA